MFKRALPFALPLLLASPSLAAPEADAEDALSLRIFVDSFYMQDWNFPDDPRAANAVGHRAYDYANGFGTGFAGLDAGYQVNKHASVQLDLRFGEGASQLIGQDQEPTWAMLKQAYVTLSPDAAGKLTLDLGQFDTILGGEYANSWENLNYTRGAIYFLQPFYHTGLRGKYDVSEAFDLVWMVVNGTNSPVDNNSTPHVALQGVLTLQPQTTLALAYYTGPGSSGYATDLRPGRDGEFEHLFDLVISSVVGPVTFVGNANYFFSGPEGGRDRVTGEAKTSTFWTLSLALGYRLTEAFAVAGRFEWFDDPDAYVADTTRLLTGTVTLDYTPFDGVIIRLDHRVETAEQDIFIADGGPQDTWMATTLGVVVKSD